AATGWPAPSRGPMAGWRPPPRPPARATVPGPAPAPHPAPIPRPAPIRGPTGIPGPASIPGPMWIRGPARPAASPPPDRSRARAPARSRVTGGDGRGGHRRGEVLRALQRREVARAVEVDEPGVGEELAQPVGPLAGEQRVMFGPQHG